jgi:molybdopterin converting factor small subunit
VLPQLEGQLACGELRPIHLFDKVRTLRIEEPELRVIDPEGWSFFNMNTPEEYDEALRHWRAVRGNPRGASGRPVRCTVELFGVAQLLTRTREVSLSLPSGATVAQVFTALAERLPVLIGRVISPDRRRLVEGYACSLNGLEFVRHSSTPVSSGDSIVIVAADAGG